MRIAEIYASRQGEGTLTGTHSVFVRASGCNLRCGYCDTPFASWEPEGDDLSVDEILQRVMAAKCEHVVITGGEPMLFAEMLPLCDELNQLRRHVTIETAGTLFLPLACDLMSISPKLSNSAAGPRAGRWQERHERTRHAPDVIHRLVSTYHYQFKFVVAARADCREVEDYLRQFPDIDRERVWLMPEGTDESRLAETGRWLEAYCLREHLHFCPRRQIQWYGNRRAT